MIFLIAISTCASTFLGGLFALRLRDRLHLILGFSAGAVIGVAFFDLLPEALDLGSGKYGISAITAIVALGFGLYLLLDRTIALHHHDEDGHDHAASRGIWGAGTLSVHSFLDGIGIGLAFQVSPAIGFFVAAAVVAHDFSDGINTVSMIMRASGTRANAFRWLAIDAVAPILGIIATLFFQIESTTLGLLLALFSGFFLYIGASDLLPESQHDHPVYWTTFATLLGMATLYVVVSLAA